MRYTEQHPRFGIDGEHGEMHFYYYPDDDSASVSATGAIGQFLRPVERGTYDEARAAYDAVMRAGLDREWITPGTVKTCKQALSKGTRLARDRAGRT